MADLHAFISWRLQRSWAQGPARWWAWSTVVVFAATATGSWLYVHPRLDRQAELANQQFVIAQALGRPTAEPLAAEADDFTRSLGAATPVVHIMEELRRSCEQAGVLLASVQVRERAPSHDLLGRAELVLTLRGSYANSKQVLKDATDRFSKLTVQRLRMRRVQSAADVETIATLSLWSASLAPAPVKSTLVAAP